MLQKWLKPEERQQCAVRYSQGKNLGLDHMVEINIMIIINNLFSDIESYLDSQYLDSYIYLMLGVIFGQKLSQRTQYIAVNMGL